MEGKTPKKSKISKVEWVILLFIAIVVDIVQIILDFFVIGVIVNRIIDVIIGIFLPTYFWFRGVSMTNWKRLTAVIGGFFLEQVPVVDALPLWSAEVAVVWATVMADDKISSIPVLGKTLPRLKRQPLNSKVGIRPPRLPNRF